MVRVGLVALSVVYIAMFVVLAAIRSRFPFELEWMEGGLVDEIGRVLAGEKIYVKPSVEFVPFIYTPLYFYVSAAFAKVLGHGFFAPRLVSILCTLGVMGMIARHVKRETGNLAMGVVGAGLYAATFHRTAQLMDIVRTDGLFVLLILIGIDRLRAGPERRARITAGVVLTLAFLAKQSALPIIAALTVYVLLEDRRQAWPFLVASAGGIIASVLVLDQIHEGWFRYYVFELPASHPLVPPFVTRFWIDDIFGTLGVAVGAAAYVLFSDDALEAPARKLWAFALAGVVACSYSGRLHFGGWSNVLLPTYAVLAIFFGIAVHALSTRAETHQSKLARAVFVAAAAQLLMLAYDPATTLPTKRERLAREHLLARIKSIPGDAWIPTHGHLSVMAGKKAWVHQMAVDDIIRQENPIASELRADIADALRRKQFKLVITDNDFFDREVLSSYTRAGEAYPRPDLGFNVTGVHYRSGELFVPRP